MNKHINNKVKKFFSEFKRHFYKREGIIFQPDDSLIGAYYLKNGYVREYSLSPQGIEVTLHIFMPGSFFPMIWVLAGVTNRYYYEALTDVQIYSAPKDIVISFIKQNPDVLLDLTKRAFLGLDKLTSRIEYLVFGRASSKVVSALLYLSRHFGKEKSKRISITHKFTHREIGSFAGISRETASRELEKLVKKGIISYKNHVFTIEDKNKLLQELEFNK